MPINEELIYKFLQGACSAEEIKELTQWINSSKENARYFFQIEECFFQGKRDPDKEARQTLQAEQRLYARIQQQKTHKTRIRKLVIHYSKYAAVFAAILIAAGVTFKMTHDLPEIGVDTIAIESNGEIRHITLPDSTQVWLNKNSRLTYVNGFTEKERRVQLEGEAYFEVRKNKERPFIVDNELLDVRVLGTTFNMKCLKGEHTASATLIKGMIEVKGKHREGRITLSPGQSAELDTRSKRLTVRQVNARMQGLWRKNLIPFEQANIRAIATTLEKYYPVKIILAQDIDLQSTYSGVLKQTGDIEAVLKSLKNSIPIEYSIQENNIYIKNRKQ